MSADQGAKGSPDRLTVLYAVPHYMLLCVNSTAKPRITGLHSHEAKEEKWKLNCEFFFLVSHSSKLILAGDNTIDRQ